jgi:hypothetical protein
MLAAHNPGLSKHVYYFANSKVMSPPYNMVGHKCTSIEIL